MACTPPVTRDMMLMVAGPGTTVVCQASARLQDLWLEPVTSISATEDMGLMRTTTGAGLENCAVICPAQKNMFPLLFIEIQKLKY